MVFAKALKGQDITAIISSLGAAPAAAAKTEEAKPAEKKGMDMWRKRLDTKKEGKKDVKKEEKKEEEKKEEEVAGFGDIFGGDM